MIGVFIYSAKPTDKAHPYKKSPKAVLDDTDENVVRNFHYAHYYIHWVDDDEIDKMDDKEIVQYMNDTHNYGLSINSRHTGKGYSTEDKNSFVRIIRNNRGWFKNIIG